MLKLTTQIVAGWPTPAVVFESERRRLNVLVKGIVGNSVATSEGGKLRLAMWKSHVAAAASVARGAQVFDPGWSYAISAGFSFNPAAHGSQALDVENFLKPTFDALAAGMFCASGMDPLEIKRFNYDDSGFRYLFVHRLSDASTPADEGVALVVSVLEESDGTPISQIVTD